MSAAPAIDDFPDRSPEQGRKPRIRSRPAALSRLPDTSPGLRLNAVCPYYTMFPLRFPLHVLSSATSGQRVLDPFAGRGTTLFAARLHGLQSVGVDSSPVAAHLATAKLAHAMPDAIVEIAERALQTPAPLEVVPEGEFWAWAYEGTTLEEICRLRAHLWEPGDLFDRDSDELTLLRALVMGILHGPQNKGLPTYLSNQMPRTYATKPGSALRYWKKRDLRPSRVSLIDALRRRANFTVARIPPHVPGRVIRGDCRKVLRNLSADGDLFDWVITSPPYFGMRSYIPDQWLRHWFVGGSQEVDYSEEGQLGGGSEDGFIDALAGVWSDAARLCAPNARLIIRFGSLPSVLKDPIPLIKRSLRESLLWRTETVVQAGVAPAGRRQADQFASSGGYVSEVDIWARRSE